MKKTIEMKIIDAKESKKREGAKYRELTGQITNLKATMTQERKEHRL